jgi:hypothetical protein
MTKGRYMFDYQAPPMVGTKKRYFKGTALTLIAVDPYQRTDGTPSAVLTWKASDGRIGTSGLRSAAITWVRQ